MFGYPWQHWLRRLQRPTPRRPRLRRCLELERLEDRLAPATVSWIAGAGDWDTAANWLDASDQSNHVPGAADDVVINTTGITVTHNMAVADSVRSLNGQADLNLTAGSLQVTAGASAINAALTVGPGTSLLATGLGTSWTATGTTTIDGANLSVSGGATLALPMARSFANMADNQLPTWQASGAGSVLDLHNVTTISTGNYSNARLSIKALGGAAINLAGTTQIVAPATGNQYYRAVNVSADGSGSSIELSALASFVDNFAGDHYEYDQDLSSTLTVTNGGTVDAPQLATVQGVVITVDSTGTLPTAQLTTLSVCTLALSSGMDFSGLTSASACSWRLSGSTPYNFSSLATADGSSWTLSGSSTFVFGALTSDSQGSFTINGVATQLPKLADIDGTSFYVSGGVSLALPAASSFANVADNQLPTWQASGAGSVLDLHNVTTISTGNYSNARLSIKALGGAAINLAGTTQIVAPATGNQYYRAVNVSADGSGSTVELSGLTSFVDNFAGDHYEYDQDLSSTLTVTNGGAIQAPLLTTVRGVVFTLDGTGTAPTAQLTTLTVCNLALSHGTDFSRLTTSDTCTWTLSGTTPYNFSALATADGSTWTLSGSATFNFSALTSATTAAFQINGAATLLPNLAHIDGTSFIVSGGVSVAVPTATSLTATTAPQQPTLQASGSGSLLDLHNLTSISTGDFPDVRVNINALAGGKIDMSGTTQLLAPTVREYQAVNVTADGAGSRIDLSALSRFVDNYAGNTIQPNHNDLSSTLTVTNGGAIQAPLLTTVRGVVFTLDGTGTFATAQLTTLAVCDLDLSHGTDFSGLTTSDTCIWTLSGSTPYNFSALATADGSTWTLSGSATFNFSALTSATTAAFQISGAATLLPNLAHIDGTSFIVSGGVSVAVPAATSLTATTAPLQPTLQASGAGSVLDLHTLTSISTGDFPDVRVNINALAGGKIDLSGTTQLLAPTVREYQAVNVTAAGAGSRIDLSALSRFVDNYAGNAIQPNHNDLSSTLTVTNGGTVQTSSTPTLTGVSVSLDGTGTLSVSTLTLGATSLLTGTGTFTANVVNGGTLNPVGQFTIAGTYQQTAAGVLSIGLGGLQAGQYSQLQVNRTATLDGGLGVALANGFTPALGNTFRILTAASVTGAFASATGLQLSNGLVLEPDSNGTTISLTVTPGLQVSSLAGSPSSPESGSRLTISWNDVNASNQATNFSWYDNVLVQNSTTGKTLLDTAVYHDAAVLGNLPAGASQAMQNVVTLPAGSAGVGDLHITVTVDSRHNVIAANNNTASITVTSVADAALSPGSVTLSATEGLAFSGSVASFSDADTAAPAGVFTATIDWGDGTAGQPNVTSGAVSSQGGGQFSVAGSHSYGAPGSYAVRVGIVDAGGSNTTVAGTANVADAPLTPGSAAVSAFQGVAFSGAVATFSDTNALAPASVFTATIDWGDGSAGSPDVTSGTVTALGNGQFSVAGAHTYAAAGTDPLSVVVHDGGGSATTITGTANVQVIADLTVTSLTGVPSSALFGQTLTLTYTVKNAGSGPATAHWSDGIYLSMAGTLDSSAALLAAVPAGSHSPLAVGDPYTQTVQVTLPLSTSSVVGTYYLLVDPDYLSQQPEKDPSRSFASPALAVTLPPLPNLVVNSISAPASVVTGQTIQLSWTDQNNGTAAANGPWLDRVYLATDAQGNGRRFLTSFATSGALAAGAALQRVQAVTLPSTPGTWWFVIITNADAAVEEGPNGSDPTTVSASSIVVSQAPLPDLVVTSITPPTNTVVSGTSVPITFVVKNQGNAPTSVPVWQDVVFLSQDSTLTYAGDDTLLINQPVNAVFHNPSYLDIGQSYSQTVNLTLPISAQGTWYVYVLPDGSGKHHPFAMPEASRTDKLRLSAGFNVTLSPPPALAVSNVQALPPNFSGFPMIVTWTVTNTGTGPTAPNYFPPAPSLPYPIWGDAVLMSAKPTLDGSATLLGVYPRVGGLDAGQSYFGGARVTLPIGISGPFYFFVETDSGQQVFQNGNIAGNVGVTPTAVTVNLTPPPRLDVGAVTAPAAALASHTLTFSYQITNAGAGSTQNQSWNDTFYLSPTSTYDASTAIALHQDNLTDRQAFVAHAGTLNAGGVEPFTITATVPDGVSGTYYLLVDADGGKQVFQLDRSHAVGASPGTIQLASRPADLVVTAASAPATAAAGGAVLVNWTVANQGTGDTAVTSWQDNVYADTGTTLTTHAVLLGSYTHSGLLDAAASYSAAQLVTLPLTLSGPYHLFVVTNETDQPLVPAPKPPVYESNGTNGTSAAVPITVNQDLADLVVTAVTAPATATTGGSVTLSWTVKNQGSGATNVNYWYDDVWLSANQALGISGKDIYLGSAMQANPLAAGASYTATQSVTLPPDLAAGSYYFVVAADRPVPTARNDHYVNLVFESNEANNETASAVRVNLAAVPDLTVTSVSGPPTHMATSGGQLIVDWTVANNGAAALAGVTDSVYLSYAADFDPARYLGSVSQDFGVAAGGSYTQTYGFQLPAGLAGTFYVFVLTNSDGYIYERNTANNAADDPTPLQISLTPPADLVAGTVTVPANAIAGQNITITYQVTNNSPNPANGSWYDALYLSPTPTWSINDPLIGTVPQFQNVAANGGRYTGTLTKPLPGVAPGDYYVIVRSNILNNLPETTLSNNLNASLTTTALDVPALTLGTPAHGGLGQEQSAYYKVDVAAGQTLQVALAGLAGLSNELYVRYAALPTRGDYDYRYQQPLQSNQTITVPTTRAGTYYILAYAVNLRGLGSEAYTLTAALIPFAVTAVAPAQVGAGTATIEIDGSRFDNRTTFQLLGPTNLTVNAQTVYLQDSSTAFVTFNLTGAPLAAYTVQATQADGTTTQLAQGLTVVAATPADVQEYVSAPKSVLPNSQGEVTVNYVNNGNTDALAPLLRLSDDNALLSLSLQDPFIGNAVQFLGVSGTGPAGTLRPGESGFIHVRFQTTGNVGQAIDFNLAVADDSQPIDWAGQKTALQPPTIPTAAWDTIYTNLVANLGPTVGSYHGAVAADATYLSQLGPLTFDESKLLSFEVEKANGGYVAPTLDTATDASLPAPGLDLTFQRSFQQALAGRYSTGILGYGWTNNWDYNLSTAANGDVTLQNDGITLLYTRQADGSYQPRPGDHGSLKLVNGIFQLVTTANVLFQFNTNGTLDFIQDANGNRITAGYSAGGQLKSLTHANGEALTFAYNPQGQLSQLTDSTGRTVTYTYDPTGQLLASATGVHGTTTYSYVTGLTPGQNNALAGIAFADHTHVFFGYDTTGRLIDEHQDGGAQDITIGYLTPGGYTITDGNGKTSTVLFNLVGATGTGIDPLGNVTHFQYDSNLNLVESDGLLGTRYLGAYDANGNLTSLTDPLNNKTAFTYDASNNLTSYTDAKGHTTRYGYDSRNNLQSITRADGKAQHFAYNPLGEATQYLNARGAAVGYTYNAQGLIAKATFPDTSSFIYTYDARGNLRTATDAHGQATTFTYADPANPDLLTKVAYPDSTFLIFSYNVVGQRTQSVDQTGYTVHYAYDGAGRLSELTDRAGARIVKYTYDAAGQLLQKDMGNGTRTVYSYDAAGAVLSIANLAPDHTSVNSFNRYTYDPLGNVLTDTNQDGQWTYTYDADGQLIHAVFVPNATNPDRVPSQDLQYAYDAAGNRLTQTVNGAVTAYAVNNVNEYTSSTTDGVTTAYGYDADGNRTTMTIGGSTTTYSFDIFNQLTGVNGPGLNATYTFDPFGNRVGQSVNGVTTHFQIDPIGLGNIVATFDGAGALQMHYTHGFGLVNQVSAAGVMHYYDANLQGSTVDLTNTAGAKVSTFNYAPFGNVLTSSGGVTTPFQFVGQFGVMSDASSLHFMRARMYDAATGQFTANDPLDLGGGDTNLRRYGLNNPSELIDPTGLSVGADRYGGFENVLRYGKAAGRAGPAAPDVYEGLGVAQAGGGDRRPPLTRIPKKLRDEPEIINIHRIIKPFTIEPGAIHLDLRPKHDLSTFEPNYVPINIEIDPLDLKGDAHVQLDGANVDIGSPADPNDIIGPAGFGDQNFVPLNQVLPYTIDFENEPTAGLPAQQVILTQQLDPNLNWGAFRLGSFGFGGQVFQVPDNTSYYFTQIDLTRQLGFLVDVTATIDERTGIASWVFTTIDPTTGQIPIDITRGFLPPDVANGIGQGFVSYIIKANQTDPTGTVINAQATVTFLTQPPIKTPRIFNTIDAGGSLTSAVAALPAVQNATSFPVSWGGTDNTAGSAIAGYTIYVSDNGGPFTAWLTNTTLTAATYTGQDGHAFGFYSVAGNNAGNRQTRPTLAQASTLVDVTPPSSKVAALASFVPASFSVSWSGADGSAGSGIASYDVFVAVDGGSWQRWPSRTPATSAVYAGQPGHGYAFYSVAYDRAGNVESKTPAAEAQTRTAALQTTRTEAEDTTAPAVISIDAMLGTHYSDADANTRRGIAVLATAGNGSWQFLSGAGWTPLGAVAQTSALLLPAADSLCFVPAPLWHGPAGLTYVAWDGSAGSSGTHANAAVLGGATPFSADGGMVAVTVTAVNHAPSWTAGTVALAPVATGPNGETVQQAFGGVFHDVDGDPTGIAIVSVDNAASGSWEYSRDGGAHWTALPPVTTAAPLLLGATDLLGFAPGSHQVTGTVSLQAYAWDGAALSRTFLTATLRVQPLVNHAPTWSAATAALTGPGNPLGDLVLPRQATNPAGLAISTIVGAAFHDSDGNRVGIALVADSGNGTWQVAPDGVGWTLLGLPSASDAILLPGTDFVRFLPAPGFVGTAALQMRAWDGTSSSANLAGKGKTGGSTAFSDSILTAAGTVNTVNDAPTWSGRSATLAPVLPGSTPGGATVASVFGSLFQDLDGAAVGIAVTGASTVQGSWQFAHAGGPWTPFGTVTTSSARLLVADDQLRFVPAARFSGTATLRALAWDGFTGVAGQAANVTKTGGTTAFSTSAVTLSVAAASPAPAWSTATVLLTPVLPGASSSLGDKVSTLLGAYFQDARPAVTPGIAVTALGATVVQGSWQYQLAGSGLWQDFGPVKPSKARLLSANDRIRFVPHAGFVGAVTLTAYAWDGSAAFSSTPLIATYLVNTAPRLTSG